MGGVLSEDGRMTGLYLCCFTFCLGNKAKFGKDFS